MTLDFDAARARRVLVILAALLPLLSLTVLLLSLVSPLPASVTRLFDVNGEMNVPAWYSTMGLMASACLLGAAAAPAGAFRPHWAALAALFAGLSADEMIGVHEELGVLVRNRFALTGYLRHAWVLPAFAALAVLGAAYLRFLKALPARTRGSFLVAGAIFVGGAAGVEMIGGKLTDVYGRASLAYALSTHVEEFMELLGIALFNAALLEHLAGALGHEGLRVRVRAD